MIDQHLGQSAAPAIAAPNRNAPASHFVQAIQAFLGDELQAVEQLIGEAVVSPHCEVQHLSRQATSMGGKRLRPMLVLLAGQSLATGVKPPRTFDLRRTAAAIELVHAASLVHDDVLDAAEQRRHQPTIAHQSNSAAAILLGDYLFTRAFALAADCRSPLVARRIADASAQLCEGELRQQLSAGNWHLSPREYRSILVQKTGVLCGISCRLGGWLSGADAAIQRGLMRFGIQLGLAFQIYDDWLDYWGTAQVGKTLGSDLQQQKATLPVIRLLRTSPPAQQRAALAALCRGTPAERFAETRRRLDASDAGSYTLAIARRCAERAQRALAILPCSVAKTHLFELAQFSVQRLS